MAPSDNALSSPIDPTTGAPEVTSTVIPPGEFPVGMLPIEHPQLAQLYRYWDRKRGDRAMPARRDIFPEELAGLLGNVFMVDVVREDGYTRFRYRVVGSALTAIMDQELAGKFIDQMPFLYRKFALPAYRELLRVGRPTYKQTNAFEGWLVIRYKRLLLPLSSDGQQIDIVMGGIYQF